MNCLFNLEALSKLIPGCYDSGWHIIININNSLASPSFIQTSAKQAASANTPQQMQLTSLMDSLNKI